MNRLCGEMRRGASATVLLVAAVLALGGCGGGGDASAVDRSPASAGTTIDKAELIAQADTICRRTDTIQKRNLAAYEETHPSGELTGKKGEDVLQKFVFPPIGTEIEEVAALGAPAGDAAELKTIWQGWRAALRSIDRRPGLVMNLGEGPFAAPDKLAAAYGFKACAKAL